MFYNRFRYYSTETGAYISQDPIGIAGNNPTFYAYVHDSNSWVDVFGLSEGIIRILVQSRPGERVSHFGVITNPNTSNSLMTDLNQLGDLGVGTNDNAKIMKNSDLYQFHKYHDIKVSNINDAVSM